MRKQKISAPARDPAGASGWLPIAELAEVDLTSETDANPVEAALLPPGLGWRADSPGEQTIRLNFQQPHSLRRIRLVFQEVERERTQQFIVRALSESPSSWREIVRQQFNFSLAKATREIEEYEVDLPAVSRLELNIIPDLRGGDARASLAELRLA